jgi:hypothetical protein
LKSGKGNCQNYCHLSAALLRAAGIPVRIVKGVVLRNPENINRPEGVTIFKIGKKKHSWIEVWFPDLGWVPFDPQSREGLAPGRLVRVEVVLDNSETRKDGLIRRDKSASSSFNSALPTFKWHPWRYRL